MLIKLKVTQNTGVLFVCKEIRRQGCKISHSHFTLFNNAVTSSIHLLSKMLTLLIGMTHRPTKKVFKRLIWQLQIIFL